MSLLYFVKIVVDTAKSYFKKWLSLKERKMYGVVTTTKVDSRATKDLVGPNAPTFFVGNTCKQVRNPNNTHYTIHPSTKGNSKHRLIHFTYTEMGNLSGGLINMNYPAFIGQS